MATALATTSTPQRQGITTNATPSSQQKDANVKASSSSSNPHSYRQLYRGSLSLPDSHLLLDGLTFSARLESPTKHQLLDNPLALALESMRGRQSLGFLGIIKLSDVWLDESGNIEMYARLSTTCGATFNGLWLGISILALHYLKYILKIYSACYHILRRPLLSSLPTYPLVSGQRLV